MGKKHAYRDLIRDLLEGKFPHTIESPGPERVDWLGTSTVFRIYEESRSEEKPFIVKGLGEIITGRCFNRDLKAQAIHIATSLRLAELQEQVNRLNETMPEMADEEPLCSAIKAFRAFIELQKHLPELPSVESYLKRSN